MLENTIRELTDKRSNNKSKINMGLLLHKSEMGRFCCSGKNIWESKLLKLVTENLMKQWVQREIRIKGEDKPSRLNLVSQKS